jgi:hypothetical protein
MLAKRSQTRREPNWEVGPAVDVTVMNRFHLPIQWLTYSGLFQLGSLEKPVGACRPVLNFS